MRTADTTPGRKEQKGTPPRGSRRAPTYLSVAALALLLPGAVSCTEVTAGGPAASPTSTLNGEAKATPTVILDTDSVAKLLVNQTLDTMQTGPSDNPESNVSSGEVFYAETSGPHTIVLGNNKLTLGQVNGANVAFVFVNTGTNQQDVQFISGQINGGGSGPEGGSAYTAPVPLYASISGLNTPTIVLNDADKFANAVAADNGMDDDVKVNKGPQEVFVIDISNGTLNVKGHAEVKAIATSTPGSENGKQSPTPTTGA